MPTGYTYKLEDGTETSPRAFALRCARAMGACISLRDEPDTTPVPLSVEPDTRYHDEALAEARAKLAAYEAMTQAEIVGAFRRDADAAMQARTEAREQDRTIADRYDRMRDVIDGWTDAPEGLREFMLEQIKVSRPDLRDYTPAVETMTPAQWQRERIDQVLRGMAYDEKRIGEIRARAAETNRWLYRLHATLIDLPDELPSRDGGPS